jgi:hypothetical protein
VTSYFLRSIFALFFLAAATPALPQTFFWKDSLGHPEPDSAARKTVSGVGAWLLVTSDEDWEAKWNTPSTTIPAFTEASTVTIGKRVFILVFVANPTHSEQGDVNVTCEFEIERPNHVVTHQHDIDCLKGKVLGSEGTLYLTKQIVGFDGEKDAHFANKDALLQAELTRVLSHMLVDTANESCLVECTRLFAHTQHAWDIFRSLIGGTAHVVTERIIQDALEKRIAAAVAARGDEPSMTPTYAPRFVASTLLTLIAWSLEQPSAPPPEKLQEIFRSLVGGALR